MTTTTTKATAARAILALDLGKYKTVACAYPPGTTAARFDTLTTSREQLRKLFPRQGGVCGVSGCSRFKA